MIGSWCCLNCGQPPAWTTCIRLKFFDILKKWTAWNGSMVPIDPGHCQRSNTHPHGFSSNISKEVFVLLTTSTFSMVQSDEDKMLFPSIDQKIVSGCIVIRLSNGWDPSDSPHIVVLSRAGWSRIQVDLWKTGSLPDNLTVPSAIEICCFFDNFSTWWLPLHWVLEHGFLTRLNFSRSFMSATMLSPFPARIQCISKAYTRSKKLCFLFDGVLTGQRQKGVKRWFELAFVRGLTICL